MAKRLAVIGHPLAAEENRLAFRGWKAFDVDLVLPVTWKSRSAGHTYRAAPDAAEPGSHALPVFASGRNSLYLWRGLSHRLEKLRPDLVYCWEEPWCLAALQTARLCRRLGAPLVFYSAENRPKRLPWPFAAVMRRVFAQACACVTPTDEIAAAVRALGYRGPTLTVPLWIRPRRAVRADAAGKTLAYVGRLIPLKRVDLLIECLPLLADYRLRIIGDGPERARLQGLARSLGVEARVAFCGHVDNGDLEARLDGSSLLVLPTGENPRQAEQFGKAALEGVACGLPVLASRTGNLARLAGEIPTLAARNLDSPRQMADAVAGLIGAYPAAAALEDSRRRVETRFGPGAVGRALEAAFASLEGPGP